MKRFMLKSKIHRCTLTDKNLEYEGSVTIDRNLMDAADLLPYEHVDIYNINNGARFTSYVIEGSRGKGDIILNGAAARLAEKGDLMIIASYSILDEDELREYEPKAVQVDGNNKIIE